MSWRFSVLISASTVQILTVVDVSLSNAVGCVRLFPAVLALAKSFKGFASFARLLGDANPETQQMMSELDIKAVSCRQHDSLATVTQMSTHALQALPDLYQPLCNTDQIWRHRSPPCSSTAEARKLADMWGHRGVTSWARSCRSKQHMVSGHHLLLRCRGAHADLWHPCRLSQGARKVGCEGWEAVSAQTPPCLLSRWLMGFAVWVGSVAMRLHVCTLERRIKYRARSACWASSECLRGLNGTSVYRQLWGSGLLLMVSLCA